MLSRRPNSVPRRCSLLFERYSDVREAEQGLRIVQEGEKLLQKANGIARQIDERVWNLMTREVPNGRLVDAPGEQETETRQ
jgi:hypothetical protein